MAVVTLSCDLIMMFLKDRKVLLQQNIQILTTHVVCNNGSLFALTLETLGSNLPRTFLEQRGYYGNGYLPCIGFYGNNWHMFTVHVELSCILCDTRD